MKDEVTTEQHLRKALAYMPIHILLCISQQLITRVISNCVSENSFGQHLENHKQGYKMIKL